MAKTSTNIQKYSDEFKMIQPPNIYFLHFLQIHIPSACFPLPPNTHTQEHFLIITVVPCRMSMTLLAGHPHPSGLYTSPRGFLKHSRCNRGLSAYEATCWILVQAKRTRSHFSNLETYLYSKKPARPKQTKRSNNTDSALCPQGDDLRHYC